MSALPLAPSAPAEAPTQESTPAPHVDESTTASPLGDPEPPVTQGTEPADLEQRTEDAEQIATLATWRDEQLKAKETELQKQHEFRLAQSRNDLIAQHQKDIEAAKADPVVSAAREAFELAKKGFETGWDDPAEAEREFKKLVSDNDGFARIVADQELEKGKVAGSFEGIAAASSELYEGLSAEAQNDLYHHVTTEIVPKVLDKKLSQLDGYKAMRAERDKILLAEHEKKLVPMIEARLKDEAKADEANAEPGPAKVAGRTVGKVMYTNEQLAKMTPREIADLDQELVYAALRG